MNKHFTHTGPIIGTVVVWYLTGHITWFGLIMGYVGMAIIAKLMYGSWKYWKV